MTGDSRCRGPTTMMGRGADGGCGTEEKPCPVSRPAPSPAANIPAPVVSPEKFEHVRLGVDLYTQALKALSERSPFDSNEVLATTVPTLPSGLASLLSKHADSRKKHKRPHSDTKSRKGSTEKSKSSNVWVELDDYFREPTLQDIERLCRLSSSFASSSSSSDLCFSIPVVGHGRRNNNKNTDNVHVGNVQAAVVKQEETDDHISDCLASEIQEVNGEIEQYDAKADNGSRDSLGSGIVEQACLPQPQGSFESCSSVEWVLGSRNRVLLTTTRPTKKRKLLGESAGLEKLIVTQPCEGSSSLCHVCSMGDTGDQLNQLVVCKSCNVVVHQKCYGVQGEVDGSWLCAWCKHIVDVKGGLIPGSDRPCVLCPKTGGAVKRFQRAGRGSGESIEFAHLFCCQWMPEVYIDDTRQMEPLLCIEEIKDVRGKLLCNLCKVRLGSCVRCSDGSCRTSFHPICAREARNKLEVWGKFGCDDIELRAFCAKHSGSTGAAVKSEQTHTIAGDSLATSYQPAVLSVNKIKKLKIGCKNGDKVTLNIGAADSKSSNLGKYESQEIGPKDASVNPKSGAGDAHGLNNMETLERNLGENVRTSRVLDLGLILEKLMDRGKVSLQQIASDIGISEDSLASKIAGNHLGAELYSKIIMWLRNHAYMDTKDLTTKVKSLIPSKAILGADDGYDATVVADLDMLDVVPVKSVPSRRRTVGKIGIMKEDGLMSQLNDNVMGNGVSVSEGTDQEHVPYGPDKSNGDSITNSTDKIVVETIEFGDRLEEPSRTSESPQLKSNNLCDIDRNGSEGTDSGKSSLVDLDLDIRSSSVDAFSHCEGGIKCGADSFVHPYIKKKLEEVQSWLTRTMPPKYDGCVEHKIYSREQPSDVDICNKNFPVSFVEDERDNGMNMHDLQNAKQDGILDLCPENEVEGEIIFYQQRLLDNAVVQKRHADQLVCKIVRNLPHQMDAVRKQRWDDVLVNQYVHELKEARKLGRKEKRYKEAQAVLAAATAAAAASSRTSSLRKDTIDECLQENQLKLGTSRGRGQQTISVPHVKETHAGLGLSKVISNRYPDISQLVTGSSKGRPRSCDICNRPESLLNPILVCSSCKVAVHLNCYRSVKESMGPWYCELCEDSSLSKSSGTAVLNSLEKPYPVAECGLCGTSTGAFRKSTSGEWVHAFCAEWVFDSTFKRGQVSPVQGMETVLKGNDVCAVCDCRYGVCIKCNYGNCQATFHPSCARSAGYYLYARSVGGGRTQRKAYCSKHSLEQRSKVETQKHAAEDLKIAKQHRVKLEKLRLLCERIVKREKLKRDLVICSHDILASKRDSLAVSIPVCHPYSSHEVSSESATTSLKGHTDGSRSCSEAMQKSDDVTVDSAFSAKKCVRLPLSMDNDQKTDDSSTSQHLPTPKLPDRVSFGGKQIPIRAAMACRNFSQRGEKRLKSRKHTETFKKELVMTSDQALMKNQRLPKGYIYVPMDSLSNGKQVTRESVERKEQDG